MTALISHEEEILALDKSKNLQRFVLVETVIPNSVVLTARKGKENQQIDVETGLPGSCIGIPFRVGREGTLEVLLMKSSRNEWRFPGGTWEKDESKEQCVVRECLEEGGLRGEVVRTLSPTFHVSRKSNKVNKRYFWFLIEIKEYFSRTAENRERQFFPYHLVSKQLYDSTDEMKNKWASAAKVLAQMYKDFLGCEVEDSE